MNSHLTGQNHGKVEEEAPTIFRHAREAVRWVRKRIVA